MTEHIKSGNEAIYLPASILFAAIILSVSIFAAGSGVGNSLTGLSKIISAIQGGGTPSQDSGNTGNVIAAPQPTPQPTQQTKKIKSLLQGAAGIEGKQDAPVVIIEYSDYQCPFCRKWFEDAKTQLDKEYIQTGKVLFLYKDFPLGFHPMAPTYAQAARCAGDEGKYWEMHDKIFEEQAKFGQGTISSLTKEDVKKWAQDMGLNSSKFNTCLDSGKYTSAVQTNTAEGASVGVSGTPSFVIGKADGTGQLIVGAQPYPVFKSAIDDLLK